MKRSLRSMQGRCFHSNAVRWPETYVCSYLPDKDLGPSYLPWTLLSDYYYRIFIPESRSRENDCRTRERGLGHPLDLPLDMVDSSPDPESLHTELRMVDGRPPRGARQHRP